MTTFLRSLALALLLTGCSGLVTICRHPVGTDPTTTQGECDVPTTSP